MRTIQLYFFGMLFTVAAAFGADANDRFTKFVDAYYEAYFRWSPSYATWAGFHAYDGRMNDCTSAGVHRRVRELNRFLSQLKRFEPSKLSRDNALDQRLLTSTILAEKQSLEVLKYWQTDPDGYAGEINHSVYLLINRDFAPIEQRLRSIISVERHALKHFACARANLKNPPRLFTEIAIQQLPSIIRFFERDVPAAVASAKDARLLAEFARVNRNLIEGFRRHEAFLKQNVLPRSNGEFRLGETQFRAKLKFQDMIETPLDELLKIGMADLRKNQQAFAAVGKSIDPAKTTAEILEALETDHPSADKLLDSIRGVLGDIRKFIVSRDIITLPSDRDPIVQETPPFKRASTFASMNTPGPFETHGTEAYYNVTLPDPTWTKEHAEQHLRGFNRGTIVSTSIHEALPGHYTQFLWFKHAPTKVRKFFGAKSNKEGWAHYTEQMMLDEGYGSGDPKLKLGQLQDALLRNARFIVSIQLHSGSMTLEEAVKFFMKDGYQTRANAELEVKRGASDATYLVYTLGKLQLLQLREDYKKEKGSQFSLKTFHNEFVKQGPIPISMIREIMLSSGH